MSDESPAQIFALLAVIVAVGNVRTTTVAEPLIDPAQLASLIETNV